MCSQAVAARLEEIILFDFRYSEVNLGFKNTEFLLNLQQFSRSLNPNLFVAKYGPESSGFKPQKLRNQFFVVFTPRKPWKFLTVIRGLQLFYGSCNKTCEKPLVMRAKQRGDAIS